MAGLRIFKQVSNLSLNYSAMRCLLSVLTSCVFFIAVQAQKPMSSEPRPQEYINFDIIRSGFSIPNPYGSTTYRFHADGNCSQSVGSIAEVNERSGKWLIRDGKTLELKFKRHKQTLQVYYFYGYYFFVPTDKVQQFLSDTKAARNEYEGKTVAVDGRAVYPGEPVLATVRPKYYSQLPPSAP